MKKTPTLLKALAERRARAAGEVSRLREIAETAAKQTAAADAILADIDGRFRRIESRLDPAEIEPIKAHKNYNGLPRGILMKTILEIITAAGPVSTWEIAAEIVARFQLDFLVKKMRLNWGRNSLARELTLFRCAGVIEKLPGCRLTGAVDHWRLKLGVAPSPDRLRTQAEAAGAEFLQFDAYHE